MRSASFPTVPRVPPFLLVFLCYHVAVNSFKKRKESVVFPAPGFQCIIPGSAEMRAVRGHSIKFRGHLDFSKHFVFLNPMKPKMP